MRDQWWRPTLVLVLAVAVLLYALTLYRQEITLRELRAENRELTERLTETEYLTLVEQYTARNADSPYALARLARAQIGWVQEDAIVFRAQPASSPDAAE